jgi:hypothetical protein
VERAVRLSPGDAEFRLKLASARQAGGGDPTSALRAAANLDTGNADTQIRLGLAAEMRGDARSAESHLLEAPRVSRQFAPRWALANYYFRRADVEHFWPWARESLLMGYGDMGPVFRLCWNMSQDANLILARAIPERRAVLNSYVQFLMREGRLEASAPAAVKLAAIASMDEQRTLVSWCNWQIDKGSSAAALQVWNTLCARHLIPFAPIDPGRAPLTDGAFAATQFGGGFAWRIPAVTGITSGMNRSPRYFWVAFGGDQPESCVPLLQIVPVAAGASYRLGIDYHTSELPAASGLRWSAIDPRTGADLAIGSPWLSSMDWTRAEVRFTGPASGLVYLTLIGRRLPGATRIAGSLELRQISLERMP